MRVLRKPLAVAALVLPMSLLACAKVGDSHPAGTGSGGSSAGGSGTGSGGVATGSGGNGSGGGVGSDGARTCGLQRFDLVRKPADLFLVLDRSASMKDDAAGNTASPPADPSKWSQVVPAVVDAVMQTDADVSWGLKTFPEDGAECAGATITPKIDVQLKAMNAAAVNAAVMATTPEGNGTPTAAAIRVAAAYLQALNDGNNKFILLATDGEPSCAGSAGALTKDTTTARTDAVAAVSAAATAAASVKTFVVGVATTKASAAQSLNDLAAAGGEAQPNPNPLANKFYLANNQAELVAAIKTITGQISSCTFPLNPTPPVPDKIAVKVSGVKAPQDTTHTNGWDYTTPDFSEVQVYGDWCNMIKTSAANMVEIVFGCQDIIPT